MMGQASFANGPEGVLRGITRWEIRDRAQAARQSIIATTRACMRQSPGSATADAHRSEPGASPDTVLELRRVVCEYAHILGALGHDARSASEQALIAVRDAYGTAEPDAPVVESVRAWCSDALPSFRA